MLIILVWLLFIGLCLMALPNLYKKRWYRELATVATLLVLDLVLFTWLAWGKHIPEINTFITTLVRS
ncbi:MAG: hypothetical protein ACM3PA_02090 [Methanomassiliicoccales archaeon]